ncbi:pirin family protein [Nitrosopumilus sp.]|uniref:pirin family protein n=1 Tax=Nitrosopumilus sp. TaxID=2024843 RepID=UPI00293128ED|nr:pirin family protein [Nitrosopumilus sp.]
MIKKIENNKKKEFESGGFRIQILFPGKELENNDTGIGTIGRIDHAKVNLGTLVPMHPHKDDEILTYLRNGKLKHKDSEGLEEKVSNKRLMMMNAGKMFYHEELALENDMLEGLQIFIRPEKQGLKPNVQFHDFENAYSINKWRSVAGQNKEFPLHIRSKTSIYDIRLDAEKDTVLPELQENNPTLLFYVFNGKVSINENMELARGESIIIKNEKIKIKTLQTADIVLFVTDENSTYFEDGMYSGNKWDSK